jgi:Leucine Rich repeat
VRAEDLHVSRSTERAESNRRGWPRQLRLSLRALMVLVLVTGGWLGWIVRGAKLRHDAVAAIERGGGNVKYNWEYKDGRAIPYKEQSPPWPQWLVRRMGVEYFGCVTKAENVSPGNADAGLGSIGYLPGLEELQLGGFLVTDPGLRHLKGMTRLQRLDLSSCDVHDQGLVHLEGLTGLQVLNLNRTWVSDAGLVHLRGLTNLRTLNLEETQVTDAGVRDLQRALPGATISH